MRLLPGGEASENRFAAVAEAAVQGAAALRHNSYKVPLTKALLRKALKDLSQQALTDPHAN
jgi:CO/xanthine dehydrogenase FAD-binding subunit